MVMEYMSRQVLLEEKHRLLKKRLLENLEKKHFVEMKINQQFEKLKKLEISLEKIGKTTQSVSPSFSTCASLNEDVTA